MVSFNINSNFCNRNCNIGNSYGYYKIFISIVPNKLSNKTIIAGPKNGKPKTGYAYTIIADDTEGYDIYYIVTWATDQTQGG